MGLRNGNDKRVTVFERLCLAVCLGETMEGTEGPGLGFYLICWKDEELHFPVAYSMEDDMTRAREVPRQRKAN